MGKYSLTVVINAIQVAKHFYVLRNVMNPILAALAANVQMEKLKMNLVNVFHKINANVNIMDLYILMENL
jgi:hypothetical protein